MTSPRIPLVFASCAAAAILSAPSHAGPFTDQLARCLVGATTESDRTALVVWMFSAASLHPAVKPIASVSEQQLDASNKQMADLVVRLLTESCRKDAQEALRYEGAATLEASFNVLGEVAGQELFSSPEVGLALSGLSSHLDAEKLGTLMNGN